MCHRVWKLLISGSKVQVFIVPLSLVRSQIFGELCNTLIQERQKEQFSPQSLLSTFRDAHELRRDQDMIIDRRWLERNLGFDPSARPAPASTFAFAKAARTSSVEDIRREIIDSDPKGRGEGESFAFRPPTGI